MDAGTPLDPNQHIDRTEYFTYQQLQEMLIKVAVDRTHNSDHWMGHTVFSSSLEPPQVTATVHLWKVDAPKT